jgi:hypothetical protein
MDQEKFLKSLHTLDYGVAGVTVAYGLFTQSLLVIALGIVGFGLAKVNIADKLSSRIKRMFQRKNAPTIIELSDNTSEVNLYDLPGAGEAFEFPRTYARQGLRIGAMTASPSRHNRLVDVAAFNHAD